MTINFQAELGYALMLVTAERIATLAFSGQRDEAARKYKAHCSNMTPEAIEIFTQTIVAFAADLQTAVPPYNGEQCDNPPPDELR